MAIVVPRRTRRVSLPFSTPLLLLLLPLSHLLLAHAPASAVAQRNGIVFNALQQQQQHPRPHPYPHPYHPASSAQEVACECCDVTMTSRCCSDCFQAAAARAVEVNAEEEDEEESASLSPAAARFTRPRRLQDVDRSYMAEVAAQAARVKANALLSTSPERDEAEKEEKEGGSEATARLSIPAWRRDHHQQQQQKQQTSSSSSSLSSSLTSSSSDFAFRACLYCNRARSSSPPSRGLRFLSQLCCALCQDLSVKASPILRRSSSGSRLGGKNSGAVLSSSPSSSSSSSSPTTSSMGSLATAYLRQKDGDEEEEEDDVRGDVVKRMTSSLSKRMTSMDCMCCMNSGISNCCSKCRIF